MPKEFMGMVPKTPSPENVNKTKIENLEHEFSSVLRENSQMNDYVADVRGTHGDTLILGGYRNSKEKITSDLAKMYENLNKDPRFTDLRLTENGISGMFIKPIGDVSKISIFLGQEPPKT